MTVPGVAINDTIVADLMSRGPVTLLADPRHPDCRGLPAEAVNRPLWLQLAGAHDLSQLREAGLELAYGTHHGDVQGFVPWSACFCVAGLNTQRQLGVTLHTEALGRWLPGATEVQAQALLAAIGLAPRPVPVRWHFRAAADLLRADGDRSKFEPDRKVALERLLDRSQGPAPGALLLVRAEPPLTDDPAQEVVHLVVARHAPQSDHVLGEDDLSWSERQSDGQVVSFRVPWHWISAMQSLDGQRGWFWPADLPPVVREPMAEDAEVWPHLSRLAGVPLPPSPSPPPVEVPQPFVLPPAQQVAKRTAVESCLSHGGAVLLVDARRPDVQVPPGLRRLGLVVFAFDLPNIEASAYLDDHGLELTMADDQGQPARVAASWPAVVAAASTSGQMRIVGFSESYPDELWIALAALRDLARRGAQAGRSGDGLPPISVGGGLEAIAMGRNAAGQYVLRLAQPWGGEQPDGSRPHIQIEFNLPLPAQH